MHIFISSKLRFPQKYFIKLLILFNAGTQCIIFLLSRLILKESIIFTRSWFRQKLYAIVHSCTTFLQFARIVIANHNTIIKIRSVYTLNLHKLQMLLGHMVIYRVKNTLFPLTLIFKPSNPPKHTLLSPKLTISSNPHRYFHYRGKGWG